jgi:hypothetical protein
MHKLFVTLCLYLALLGGVSPVHGATLSAKAREIQAAFLVRFTTYVKWPEGTFVNQNSPVIIWIIGKDPFGSVIDNIARSFTANGRQIEIRRCAAPEELGDGNIAFLSPSLAEKVDILAHIVVGHSILLVGNSPQFLENGGMINFIHIGSKIRFDISKTNCDNAGLEMSSKLLKVAHAIR